jgi:ABC-type enterochelin transport system permease subunit
MNRKLFLLLMSLTLSSCATIISGKTQNVLIQTSNGQTGVEAEIRSGVMIQTVTLPSAVMVKKDETAITVMIKDSKCFKKTITTSNTPKYDLIMILGGIPGTITDMNTGAAWKYESNLTATVQPKHASGCKAVD